MSSSSTGVSRGLFSGASQEWTWVWTDAEDEASTFDKHGNMYSMYYTEVVFISSGWAWCNFNVHIFSIFGRLYHIHSEIDMHIFSIFGHLYHINSKIDMNIFSIFRSKYHFNRHTVFLCTLLQLVGYWFRFLHSNAAIVHSTSITREDNVNNPLS